MQRSSTHLRHARVRALARHRKRPPPPPSRPRWHSCQQRARGQSGIRREGALARARRPASNTAGRGGSSAALAARACCGAKGLAKGPSSSHCICTALAPPSRCCAGPRRSLPVQRRRMARCSFSPALGAVAVCRPLRSRVPGSGPPRPLLCSPGRRGACAVTSSVFCPALSGFPLGPVASLSKRQRSARRPAGAHGPTFVTAAWAPGGL